jgi:hypothetical protein
MQIVILFIIVLLIINSFSFTENMNPAAEAQLRSNRDSLFVGSGVPLPHNAPIGYKYPYQTKQSQSFKSKYLGGKYYNRYNYLNRYNYYRNNRNYYRNNFYYR